MARIQLSEVFGISTRVPQYTYIDRNKLDDTFLYYLGRDQHIVIYGGSKQGKTVLRKKHLKEEDSVVVNCREGQVLEHIYLEILRQLNVRVDTQVTESLKKAGKIAADAEVDTGIPFFGRWKGKFGGEGSAEKSKQTISQPVGVDPQGLEYIAQTIRESKKRIVLEDFHYLSEQQQRRLAFDLKGFWDNQVFMIIIGIWEEDNLLTYYNGDLSGRVQEIDVNWTNDELRQLLSKGSNALNVRFSDEIEDALVSDSSRNVGLLQQLAEKLCFAERITESTRSTAPRPIVRIDTLNQVRERICSDLSSRYRKFYEAMKSGFEGVDGGAFREVVRACATTVAANDLATGIDPTGLALAIQDNGDNIESDQLQQTLDSLNRLQVEKQIYPMVLYYNLDMQKLLLADKEFLFYRQYCQPHWN